MCTGKRSERGEFLVVHAHDRHAVHLDREPLFRGKTRKSLHHRAEHWPPRDGEERPSIERIEAEIHRIEPCVKQLIHHRAEQDAVRRECHRLNARDLLQPAHKARDVTPHERLAARQAHLANAQCCERTHIAQDLLIGQHIRVAQLLDPVRRHTVTAAQIAAVRHGDAQIFNFPLKLILHDEPSIYTLFIILMRRWEGRG